MIPRSIVTEGFIVPVAEALDILEATQPEAAGWWRSNYPPAAQPDSMFLFDAPACQFNAQC